ncbi:hypothetical protein ACF08N_38060 [Streptomyces sp. NPDC015127]|uniref:hypothetical protein n=1 Tax=Streptomyces sp. NPDC015127 TaxID=3364939 RepID=UPI0036FDA3EF
MPHSEGQRVEYRDDSNRKCQGTIQNVQGSGQNAMYVIQNEKNQQQDRVPENRVERDL